MIVLSAVVEIQLVGDACMHNDLLVDECQLFVHFLTSWFELMQGYQLVQGLIWIWCQFLPMQGCLNWLSRLREHSVMASVKANGSDAKGS